MLVVDGGASLRCALLGDNIAEMAYKNGWSVSGPSQAMWDCKQCASAWQCMPHPILLPAFHLENDTMQHVGHCVAS